MIFKYFVCVFVLGFSEVVLIVIVILEGFIIEINFLLVSGGEFEFFLVGKEGF